MTRNVGPLKKCYAVEAHYIPATLPEHAGNPFVEALPAIATQKELLLTLQEFPPYSESERELPRAVRAQMVSRLFDFFQPLGRHIDIGMRIDMMMRAGYRKRNPKTPEYRARMQKIYRMSQEGAFDGSLLETPAPSMSMSLIGVSGTGKTRSLRRSLARYPQVIWHPEHQMYQIPWLIVECPHDGSVKQLCLSFFKNVDKVLGDTNYARRFGGKGMTNEGRLAEVAQIACVHNIGVIVFDELQHIRPAGPLGIEKMLNFFVTMVNLSEAPVVLVGTMSAQHLLQIDFRQARRGAGLGGLVWPRFERDKEWEYLMKSLWRYQWTKNKTDFSTDVADVLYERTQGIVDLAVKLYVLAQYRAMANKMEVVTPALLNEVAEEEFKLLKPMLDALKSGDMVRIAKFDDLRPLDFEQQLAREQFHLQEKIDVIELRRTVEDDEKLRRAKMIQLMKDAGMDAASAELAANVVFGTSEGDSKPEEAKSGMAVPSQTHSRSRAGRKKTPVDIACLPLSDLRRITSTDCSDRVAYDALATAGVICGPSTFFST
ncbi:ATP-binding protein [Paraburkholderia tagetis]|uniref:ATP-binding protein n=1 Tax=Paraburkholderia tagetis TaxID=2913261 RepID=A0A9X1RTN3_9BURK|nr:ATP-binding protein [Paraburkholderia tagetis]MCG5076244.1 ATP-binding protein [Paraburkholderia tagetis]